MKTPWLELLTHPARPSSAARRWTNGRKPTPWTAPRTAIFKRVVAGAFKLFIEPDFVWELDFKNYSSWNWFSLMADARLPPGLCALPQEAGQDPLS
jgi:hypothetical protein